MAEVSNITTSIINSFQEFSEAIPRYTKELKTPKLWWRGNADSRFELLPNIFRPHIYKDQKEHNFINYFISRATVRYPSVPQKEDYSSWLFLMQHYGLPTRLLDWTESPLVALYFAVTDSKLMNLPGAIWGLAPAHLNESQGLSKSLALPNESGVQELFTGAFRSVGTDKVVAVLTNQFDIRHLVQLTAFTIHGGQKPLNQLPSASKYVVKLEIPAGQKLAFQDKLKDFGITESFLFPDLEHLASEISQFNFQV